MEEVEHKYEKCPYCRQYAIELIIVNYDNLTGMARCRNCFKKMRLEDYDAAKEAMRIRDGGRIDEKD